MARKFFIHTGFITQRGEVVPGYTCSCGDEQYAGTEAAQSTFRAQHATRHAMAGDAYYLAGEVVRGCPKCGELSDSPHWNESCEKAWKDAYEAVSQPA